MGANPFLSWILCLYLKVMLGLLGVLDPFSTSLTFFHAHVLAHTSATNYCEHFCTFLHVIYSCAKILCTPSFPTHTLTHLCACTSKNTHAFMHTHAHTHTHIHKHRHKHRHARLHAHTCTHTYTHTQAHTQAQTRTLTCTHMHTHIHTYTSTYTNTDTRAYMHLVTSVQARPLPRIHDLWQTLRKALRLAARAHQLMKCRIAKPGAVMERRSHQACRCGHMSEAACSSKSVSGLLAMQCGMCLLDV